MTSRCPLICPMKLATLPKGKWWASCLGSPGRSSLRNGSCYSFGSFNWTFYFFPDLYSCNQMECLTRFCACNSSPVQPWGDGFCGCVSGENTTFIVPPFEHLQCALALESLEVKDLAQLRSNIALLEYL